MRERRRTEPAHAAGTVTEVLDTIAPPYSPEFVNLFLPLVENEEIVGGVRREGDEDPVSEFVVHCRANYQLA